MPIKPENRKRYPPNWREISNRIRFERAGGRCEQCGAQHKSMGYRESDGTYVMEVTPEGEFVGDGSMCMADGDEIKTKSITIILTTSHIDHNPENNDDSNLLALCQRCHLRHDLKHHMENARQTRHRKRLKLDEERGQGRLFK